MILRVAAALVAAVALGAVGTAALRESGEDDQLRRDVGDLQRRVSALELRATRLEVAREDDARRAERTRLALDALVHASERLATGDPDVGEALDYAEGALTAQAAWSIRAARTAIAHKDLGLARQYLLAAISDSGLQPTGLGVR